MGAPERLQPEKTKEQLAEYKTVEQSVANIPENYCRRMIFIDGANVIHSVGDAGNFIMDFSKSEKGKLTSVAILIMVQKLITQGFEVVVLMKKYYDQAKNSEHSFILQLKELELVRFVDDGPDDDDVLLCTAEFYGGAVISNDSFWQTSYDHYPEAKSRRIDFRYGKSEVLREDFHKPEVMVDMFTKLIFNNFAHAYVKPGDSDFKKVKLQQKQYRQSGYHERATRFVCVMNEFLQFEMCQFSAYCKKIPILPYFNTQEGCPRKFSNFKQAFLKYEERNRQNVYHS